METYTYRVIESWALAVGQSVVLGVLSVAVFGGVVVLGYRLLGRWLD